MTEPTKRPCRACGMPLEFATGPEGKMMPLQRIRSFYVRADPLHGGELRKLEMPSDAEAGFVSHFETCPNADVFSRRNRSE